MKSAQFALRVFLHIARKKNYLDKCLTNVKTNTGPFADRDGTELPKSCRNSRPSSPISRAGPKAGGRKAEDGPGSVFDAEPGTARNEGRPGRFFPGKRKIQEYFCEKIKLFF